MIGQKVLGYRVEELIGRGSFATVYKVKKENESGTYVRALKRIIIPDEEQYRRIWNAMGHDKRKTDLYFQNVFEETMQEIQLMHAFTENGVKNVVACYENDVIRHMDPIQYEIYILMEYLTPLSDYICNHNLNVEELIDIGVQILDALEVCHANHIIHRDIKEANIFVTPNGIYKLGDFGVAAIQNEQRFVSSIKGTAGYMAPEVYHKSEKYDESVDLYSLGIVLYKLGNHMRSPFMPAYPQEFDSQDSRNALLKRMSEAPVPLPDAIPKNLGRVILKALETKKYRYCSAEKFKDELLKVKKSLSNEQLKKSLMKDKSGTTTSIDLDNSVPIKESNKRIKRWILALSVMGLLGIGVLTSVFISHKHSMELQQSWKKGSIVPFITISMEMTEKDFKNYYGKRFTEGIDGQYYLEMPDEEGGFATVTFSEGMLISVSYSFERSEDQWKEICDDFYQKWMIEGDEWPYIAEKEEVRVVLDYDKPNKEASLFLKRIE